jgi:hypothetical protein
LKEKLVGMLEAAVSGVGLPGVVLTEVYCRGVHNPKPDNLRGA